MIGTFVRGLAAALLGVTGVVLQLAALTLIGVALVTDVHPYTWLNGTFGWDLPSGLTPSSDTLFGLILMVIAGDMLARAGIVTARAGVTASGPQEESP